MLCYNLCFVDFFCISYGMGWSGWGCFGVVSYWIYYFYLIIRFLICEDDFSGCFIFVIFKF